jgi:ATP-dependent Lon protease
MAKREVTKLNSKELRNLIITFIENNKHLQEGQKNPVALNIEGDAGLGKTSLIRQVASELNYEFVKLNLSQLEDIGD